jgi:FG-GAP-like repeat/Domain of unknown function (DUF4347)
MQTITLVNNISDSIETNATTLVGAAARAEHRSHDKLQSQSHLLQSWGVNEIALYSCEVAQGDIGKSFIYQLSELTGATVAAAATKTWQVVGTGDFNGDKKAETIWRNTTDGSISISQYTPPTAPPIVGVSPTSLQVAGTGDFNGDGKADILWRNDDGRVVLWQMNGSTVVSSLATSLPSADSTWKITGTGDFNSDGKADILWRNDNGSVAVWQMNGADVISSSLTSTPLVDNSWKIAAPIL